MTQASSDDRLQILAGVPVLVCAAAGEPIGDGPELNDLVGNAMAAGADLVAVPVGRLVPDFFDLSTRIAGEAIQKFVNYHLRLAFVGDLSERLARSSALRDFVGESNRGNAVWFVEDLPSLAMRLAAHSPL